METFKYFMIILLGLLIVVASWYAILGIVVLTIAALFAISFTKVKKAWNGT